MITWSEAVKRLHPSSLRRRVQRGDVVRVHPGVYAATRGVIRFFTMLAATQKWLGAECCASAPTSLHLHRVDGFDAQVVDYVVPADQRRTSPGATIRTAQVRPQDITDIEGFRVMTIARALVHLCEIGADRMQIVVAYEDNYRRSQRHREALKECVAFYKGRGRDLSVLEELIKRDADNPPPTDSEAEARFYDILTRHGIVLKRQYFVYDAKARISTKVDFAITWLRLAFQFDGFDPHNKKRRKFRNDRRLDRRLKIARWDCCRYVWEDLFDEERLVAEVRAIMDARRLALGNEVAQHPEYYPTHQLELGM
ncbi:MAG: type IV toxin-antitoxin system AbiEi family antitoxin domain-containing protein [Myxococcaceae bacterium]